MYFPGPDQWLKEKQAKMPPPPVPTASTSSSSSSANKPQATSSNTSKTASTIKDTSFRSRSAVNANNDFSSLIARMKKAIDLAEQDRAKFPPISDWGKDPLFWGYMRLPAHLLTTPTDHPGGLEKSRYLRSLQHWFYPSGPDRDPRPIRGVFVTGVIVGVELRMNKTNYWIDDGTSVIIAVHWHANGQFLAPKTTRSGDWLGSGIPVGIGAPRLARRGECLSVFGRLDSFRHITNIIAEGLWVNENPADAEALHWALIETLRREVYDVPTKDRPNVTPSQASSSSSMPPGQASLSSSSHLVATPSSLIIPATNDDDLDMDAFEDVGNDFGDDLGFNDDDDVVAIPATATIDVKGKGKAAANPSFSSHFGNAGEAFQPDGDMLDADELFDDD